MLTEGEQDGSDEEIIDVESTDEFNYQLKPVDQSFEFCCARTTPITFHNLRRSSLCTYRPIASLENDATLQVKQQMIFSSSGFDESCVGCNPYNPEQLADELDELQGHHMFDSIISTVLPVDSLTESLEVPSGLDDNNFSILGIDNIEAGDLDSLFEKFEEVVASAPESSAPVVPALPDVPDVPAAPAVSAPPAPKRSTLTLSEYRKLRGIKPSTNTIAISPHSSSSSSSSISSEHKLKQTSPVVSLPAFSTVDKENLPAHAQSPLSASSISDTQTKHKKIDMSMMPAALLVPPQLLSKKTLPKQPTSNPISINTRTPVEPLPSANLSHKQPPAPLNCKEKPKQVTKALKNPGHTDHDYCESTTRDIKTELQTLLDKIPGYLSACASQSSLPLSSNSSASNSQSHQSSPQLKETASELKEDFLPGEDCAVMKDVDEKMAGGNTPLPRIQASPARESSRKRKYIAVKDSGRSSPISSESPTSSYRSNHSESDVTLDSYNSDASCDCNGSCRCGVAVRRHHRRPSSRYSQKKSHLSKSSQSSRYRRTEHYRSRSKRRKYPPSLPSSPCSNSSTQSRSPSIGSNSDFVIRRHSKDRKAHEKALGEQRVVYVGGISSKYTKSDIRKRFGGFGEIENVSIFLKKRKENYGLVTFYSKADAYAAVEKGNDVYGPKFNLGFGDALWSYNGSYADVDRIY